MTGHLTIHVIGPQFGEAIVMEFPDGSIGVIDSFAACNGKHPVIAFLENRFPRVSSLRFLGVSHPHADRCFRVHEIVERFPPKEVWVFHPFPAGHVQRYYKALAIQKTRERVEEALGLPIGSVAESLLRLHRLIAGSIQRGETNFRPWMGGQEPARYCNGEIQIRFLAPVSNTCFIPNAGKIGTLAHARSKLALQGTF